MLAALKKHATTIVIVLLAVGVGLWLLRDRDKVTTGERALRDNDVFPAWRRNELSRIEIAHEGETIVFERDAKDATSGAWRMTSPRSGRVDPAAVERLLQALEFATVLRKVSDGPELGLDTPRAAGKVTMGALVQRFALGAPSPRPPGSSYFRVGDGTPVVVSRELTDALLLSSDGYRDRTVVPYLTFELAKFEIVRPGESGFVLERIDDRNFRVGSEGVLASRGGVDRVWEMLAQMRAESFPTDADADRLTASPRAIVTLTPKVQDKPASELVIGEACPGKSDSVVVVRRTPSRLTACAPRVVLETLSGVPSSLVERHLFTLHADEIEELRLEWLAPQKDAPSAIEIARKAVGFHAREPFDRDLTPEEADAASELVSRIASMEAVSVARGGGAAVSSPIARVRVRNGDHEETISIGPEANGDVVLHRAYDDARLTVPHVLADVLLPRATSLRPRTLLEEAQRATRIVLRCGTPQDIVDKSDGFHLVEPKGYEIDSSVSDLVDAVTRDKVSAWVSDHADDPAFGFRDSHCRVTFTLEGAHARTVVLGGRAGNDGVYGVIDGESGVFVAPARLHELASAIYVSRAVLRAPEDEIEKVSVTLNGAPVPAAAAAARDPAALRQAAAALYADRVVSLGTRSARGEIAINIAVTEAGAQKHVVCSAPDDESAGEWLCSVAGVNATFGVAAGKLTAFLPSGTGSR
ncbi:MAG: DUF4340 domain-containing protein [Polyangiaceae bacterium]|nr:DUF4340 domain-containing protein [Polyangiaceae bacterium]